jgi:hypothetical protein
MPYTRYPFTVPPLDWHTARMRMSVCAGACTAHNLLEKIKNFLQGAGAW